MTPTFIDRFYGVLTEAATRPLVTEIHGDTPRPTTGAELAAQVARARGALRFHGVSAGDRVVFIAPNSTAWVALDLAILGEGAIAVPLYARQAVAELAGMIRDCAPSLIVAHSQALLEELTVHGIAPIVTLASLFSTSHPTVSEPPRPRTPDDPVTIIYTSGTSGEPKGVVYAASNVDFMLPVIQDAIGRMLGSRRDEDRVFHYLPLCFAGSRMVLWMTLARGRNIMLSTDLQDLARELKTARPNYYLNVPALLERVRHGVEAKVAQKPAPIRALWKAGKSAYAKSISGKTGILDRATLALAKRVVFEAIRKQIGADLDCLICGSAALPEESQRWFEMLGIPVYQVYGLTETTAIVTMDVPGHARPGEVGRVIDGVRLRLGEEDELQVFGPNIFSSYWGRPEATAETRTEDGWFRTGDQAELTPDGGLKLIGRVKNLLVPVSGHNVAPEPLEERLLAIPGVEQAVVFGHAKPYLVAILTGDRTRESLTEEIEAINKEFPHYKRIRNFAVSAERLTPENGCLTANMKLKRKAIAHHFQAQLEELYR